MARGGKILGKRGLSPLIATVLLMAFAVALGGMIMNWKFDFNVNTECEELKEHIRVSQLCAQESTIILRAQAGQESPPVQSVKLVITDGTIENTVNVLNSKVQAGGRLDLSIPVLVPENSRVDLIGVVGPAAEPYVCKDTPIERVNPILPC